MYKYFRELDNIRDFKSYLIRQSFDKNRDLFINNISFSDNLLKDLDNLFPKLNIVDEMIVALDEKLLMKTPEYNLLSYEEWLDRGDFFQHRDESYLETHDDLRKKIDLTSWNLECILNELSYNIDYLIDFYPKYKEFLLCTQKEIHIILSKIKTKSVVKIPPESNGITINWPNSWYITPNGYLYNTGFGHKRGNLIYSFYYDIYELFEYNKKVPNINYHNYISNILKRGYITYEEFENYSHLIYKLPTIITPEVEHDMERLKNMSEEESRKMLSSKLEYPKPERSYQRNLITLITGHLAAETELYSSFVRMNESCNKNELITQLRQLTMNDLRDILVRYSGFHKIESILDKTITTCSLNGITEFSEYLKKGWNLHIIPGIIYDKKEDKLSEVDFSSYFVSKHLDSELEKYEGKGKILIKDKWIK